MRKFLVCGVTSAAFLFCPHSYAKEFHHSPYIGLGAGLVTTHHDANLVRGTALDDFSLQEQTAAGEIFLGWGGRWCRFFGAGELNYLIQPNNDSTATLSGAPRPQIAVGTNYGIGGALRVGYFVLPDAMIYGRIGLEYRKFDVKVNLGTASNNIDTSFKKIGWVPGVGFEYNLPYNFTLGGEFRTAFYTSNLLRSGTTSIKVQPRVDTYLLRVSYKLGQWTH